MPRHEAIDGIVIRVRDVGAHDRYLTVLTAEKGRISILSKGSHSVKGQQVSVSQLYTYANFEYYNHDGMYILKGGSAIQPFYALSMEMDRLNLAAYLCDLACELTDEGVEAGGVLRLLLNSLYAVSRDLYPQETVKGAFEWRLMAMSGYEPDVGRCCFCGKNDAEHWFLDVMNGALICPDCLHKRASGVPKSQVFDDLREADILSQAAPSVLAALRYCLTAPLERLFSFALTEGDDLRDFAKIAETYVLSHLGRSFESLSFYHLMREPKKPSKD